MIYLFLFAAISSCLLLITDLARPILTWNPQGIEPWLVKLLKILAIGIGSMFIIAGAVCYFICMAALTFEPQNKK
jgi:hypothetical protein